MKHTYLLFFALLTLAAFVACDDIPEDERWINRSEVEVERNVLIEDFTGQRCVNCPNATDVITSLQANILAGYGKQHVVAVAIHGGSMSLSDATAMGLATAEGTAYHEGLGLTTWPCGRVNRGAVCNYDQWTAQAIQGMTQEPLVLIDAKRGEGSIEVSVNTSKELPQNEDTAEEDGPLSGVFMLTVWITESDITALQFMPDGTINPNYIHNHVFRETLTSMGGDMIDYDGTKPFVATFAYTLDSRWNPDNIHFVVFVTRNGEVLQVEEF